MYAPRYPLFNSGVWLRSYSIGSLVPAQFHIDTTSKQYMINKHLKLHILVIDKQEHIEF